MVNHPKPIETELVKRVRERYKVFFEAEPGNWEKAIEVWSRREPAVHAFLSCHLMYTNMVLSAAQVTVQRQLLEQSRASEKAILERLNVLEQQLGSCAKMGESVERELKDLRTQLQPVGLPLLPLSLNEMSQPSATLSQWTVVQMGQGQSRRTVLDAEALGELEGFDEVEEEGVEGMPTARSLPAGSDELSPLDFNMAVGLTDES